MVHLRIRSAIGVVCLVSRLWMTLVPMSEDRDGLARVTRRLVEVLMVCLKWKTLLLVVLRALLVRVILKVVRVVVDLRVSIRLLGAD